jgi:hypothetical protein
MYLVENQAPQSSENDIIILVQYTQEQGPATYTLGSEMYLVENQAPQSSENGIII